MLDRTTIRIDAADSRLRRVGRLARRRMRIEGDALRNGVHTDGTLTVEITGLGSPVAGAPDSFEWTADRPIALMIVRSGLDGDDVSFQVGPLSAGIGRGSGIGDGTGIRYVAFCYDAVPSPVLTLTSPVAVTVPAEEPAGVPVAAFRTVPPTANRPSILGLLLHGAQQRRATA
jgi:hypothetical protein